MFVRFKKFNTTWFYVLTKGKISMHLLELYFSKCDVTISLVLLCCECELLFWGVVFKIWKNKKKCFSQNLGREEPSQLPANLNYALLWWKHYKTLLSLSYKVVLMVVTHKRLEKYSSTRQCSKNQTFSASVSFVHSMMLLKYSIMYSLYKHKSF